MPTLILIALLFCWSCLLSIIAHQLIGNSKFFSQPTCYECTYHLAWYQVIPGARFFANTHCAHCYAQAYSSSPALEIGATLALYALSRVAHPAQVLVYFIFFSALIITIKTDWETFMISRFACLFLIPFGIVANFFGLLDISPVESVLTACGAYILLRTIAWLFFIITGKNGMGEGDWELFAFIGSVVGLVGAWFTLTLGSSLGALFGIAYVLLHHDKQQLIIPFGPFLALGAMSFVLLKQMCVLPI